MSSKAMISIIIGIIVLIIIGFFVTSKCPSGYDYIDNQCVMLEKKPANQVSGCKEGYNMVDGKCTKRIAENGKKIYTCPDYANKMYTITGPTLNGAKCEFEASYKQTDPKAPCIDGTKDYSNPGTCHFTIILRAELEVQCEQGFVREKEYCVKNDVLEPEMQYACDENYTLVDNECQKYIYEVPGIYFK